MLREPLRRVLDLVVLFFALLGFCSVPLGRRTAYEHCRALLATDAGAELVRGLGLLVQQTRKLAGGASPPEVPSNAAVIPCPRTSDEPADAGADVSEIWPGPG